MYITKYSNNDLEYTIEIAQLYSIGIVHHHLNDKTCHILELRTWFIPK